MGRADDCHRSFIAINPHLGPKRVAGMPGGAEKRLAGKRAVIGARDKAYRVDLVLKPEDLGLVQRFTGNGSHQNPIAVQGPIIGQILERIGRGPVKRVGYRTVKIAVRGAFGGKLKVFDLLVRQDQLGGKARRIKRLGLGPQGCQIADHVL